jgi:hypothetical protein
VASACSAWTWGTAVGADPAVTSDAGAAASGAVASGWAAEPQATATKRMRTKKANETNLESLNHEPVIYTPPKNAEFAWVKLPVGLEFFSQYAVVLRKIVAILTWLTGLGEETARNWTEAGIENCISKSHPIDFPLSE